MTRLEYQLIYGVHNNSSVADILINLLDILNLFSLA
jgi:hypothetical protein